MLGIATAFNALSHHGACTAIFVAVAAVIGFGLGSIQTLGRVSILAWIGIVSILSASKLQPREECLDINHDSLYFDRCRWC